MFPASGGGAPQSYQQKRNETISRLMNVPQADLMSAQKLFNDQLAAIGQNDPQMATAIKEKQGLIMEAIRTRDLAGGVQRQGVPVTQGGLPQAPATQITTPPTANQQQGPAPQDAAQFWQYMFSQGKVSNPQAKPETMAQLIQNNQGAYSQWQKSRGSGQQQRVAFSSDMQSGSAPQAQAKAAIETAKTNGDPITTAAFDRLGNAIENQATPADVAKASNTLKATSQIVLSRMGKDIGVEVDKHFADPVNRKAAVDEYTSMFGNAMQLMRDDPAQFALIYGPVAESGQKAAESDALVRSTNAKILESGANVKATGRDLDNKARQLFLEEKKLNKGLDLDWYNAFTERMKLQLMASKGDPEAQSKYLGALSQAATTIRGRLEDLRKSGAAANSSLIKKTESQLDEINATIGSIIGTPGGISYNPGGLFGLGSGYESNYQKALEGQTQGATGQTTQAAQDLTQAYSR
jgi:hypothetical protein